VLTGPSYLAGEETGVPGLTFVAAFSMPSCRARVTYPNGDVFEGSFNDAKQKHGSGVYTWSVAEGSNPWVPEGGLPEGRAVRYEGSWIEGSRAGIGKVFYPNGDRYHGEWQAFDSLAPLLNASVRCWALVLCTFFFLFIPVWFPSLAALP
jgi:hypothetical protein